MINLAYVPSSPCPAPAAGPFASLPSSSQPLAPANGPVDPTCSPVTSSPAPRLRPTPPPDAPGPSVASPPVVPPPSDGRPVGDCASQLNVTAAPFAPGPSPPASGPPTLSLGALTPSGGPDTRTWGGPWLPTNLKSPRKSIPWAVTLSDAVGACNRLPPEAVPWGSRKGAPHAALILQYHLDNDGPPSVTPPRLKPSMPTIKPTFPLKVSY